MVKKMQNYGNNSVQPTNMTYEQLCAENKRLNGDILALNKKMETIEQNKENEIQRLRSRLEQCEGQLFDAKEKLETYQKVSAGKNISSQGYNRNRGVMQDLRVPGVKSNQIYESVTKPVTRPYSYDQSVPDRNTSSNKEVERLNQENSSLSSELERVKGENELLENQNTTLQCKLDDYEKVNKQLQQKNNQNEVLKAQLLKDKAALEAELQRLTLVNQQQQEQINKLKEDNKSIKDDLNKKAKEATKVYNQIVAYNKRLEKELKKLKTDTLLGFKMLKASSGAYDAELNGLKEDEQRFYLSVYRYQEVLDSIEDIVFLLISLDFVSSVSLDVAGNYKNALLIMFNNGNILPNPYYFNEIAVKGETIDKLKKISNVFEFNVNFKKDKKYCMVAVKPAISSNVGNRVKLNSIGKIWFRET